MRLDTAREATITNLGGSRKFQMKASAKAFQILSSGIYERKPEAIVRELSCNANDSHIMAGKAEVPFRVQLPTAMNDFIFAVEDFGVGLSELEVAGGFVHNITGEEIPWSIAQSTVSQWEEDCKHAPEDKLPPHPYLSNGYQEVGGVYTTYFESTKTDSNDVIGALGLGSKTPFSYTDSFSIRARKDGKECSFSAQIAGDGEPEVIKLYERPWDGENGVEVSVEIASRDVSEFYSCAEKVLSWFDVKPICNRELSYDVSEDVVANVREYGYHLEGKTGFGRSTRAKVIMGNVAYDLDLRDLRADSGTDLGRFVEQLYNMKADIFFEVAIGDADVAASRETLSLDDKTRKNLLDKLDEIRVNFEENTKKKISGMVSVFEAIDKLTPYERRVVINEPINGYTLSDYNKRGCIPDRIYAHKTTDVLSQKDIEVNTILEDYDIGFYGEFGGSWKTKARSKRDSSCNYSYLVNTSHKIPVIINDCERKIGLKDAIMANNNLRNFVMVVCDKNTTLTPELQKALDHLTCGAFEVIYASTFWDGKMAAKKTSSGGLEKQVVKAQIMDLTQSFRSFEYLMKDFSELDKSRWAFAQWDGYFVRIELTGTSGSGMRNMIAPTDLKQLAKELDLDGIVAYNANNGKKVKRVLGEHRELGKLIEAVASESSAQATVINHKLDGLNKPILGIFDGYQKMFDSLKRDSVPFPRASHLVFGHKEDLGQEIEKAIKVRTEVFKNQLRIARESSPAIKILTESYNFEKEVIPEIKVLIEKRKEK